MASLLFRNNYSYWIIVIEFQSALNDICINERDLEGCRGGMGVGCVFSELKQIVVNNNNTLPRSLRSRYSAASINICTIPIAAIFNNNTDKITIRWGIPWLYTTASGPTAGSRSQVACCSVSDCFERRGVTQSSYSNSLPIGYLKLKVTNTAPIGGKRQNNSPPRWMLKWFR